jgi:hypothetical protein
LYQATRLVLEFKDFEMVKLSWVTYLGEKYEDFFKW